MTRRIMGPFSRVEGHLEIELERNETTVIDARVNAPLYRGMETVMLGQAPLDVLSIAPRICGICSVAQSVASVKALRHLAQKDLIANAQAMENLILGCEILSNHLTHFYLFFMPDFADPVYEEESWFQSAQIFQSQRGSAQKAAIEARTHLLEMMGILAGKWPHTLCIRPGGSTVSLKSSDLQKLKIILKRFQRFLETQLFGLPLSEVRALTSSKDLKTLKGDFGFFQDLSTRLHLETSGHIEMPTLSAESFGSGPKALFVNGLAQQPHDTWAHAPIKEDLSHSFMAGTSQSPLEKSTPDFHLDKDGAYSWCKAPRVNETACEVGAYARHLNLQTPLVVDQFHKFGSTVATRINARTLEMAFLCDQMALWLSEIDPSQPFFEEVSLPENGQGFGALEAARGTLMHWLDVENGAISHYQIIAPTTWNFSPRDGFERKAPLEAALSQAPIRPGENEPISVRHIVRSFDPCMACTVH